MQQARLTLAYPHVNFSRPSVFENMTWSMWALVGETGRRYREGLQGEDSGVFYPGVGRMERQLAKALCSGTCLGSRRRRGMKFSCSGLPPWCPCRELCEETVETLCWGTGETQTGEASFCFLCWLHELCVTWHNILLIAHSMHELWGETHPILSC